MAVNAFVELVRQNQRLGMTVAEVGCFNGDTAMKWLPIVKAKCGGAILVDYFMGNPGVIIGNPHGELSYDPTGVMAVLISRVADYNDVAILKGDSVKMASRVPDLSIDICFIDADHRYSHVLPDIYAWKSKVKPGGLLCGHDCESLEYDDRYLEMDYAAGNHHGVAKAIAEVFKGNVRLIGDSVWVFQMP